MESKTKNLISFILKNPDGSETDVGVGDKVSLLNPEIFQNSSLRRNQKYLNRIIRKEIGKGPYEVLRIYQESQEVYLDIKGKRKIMENILGLYFFKRDF